MNRRSALGREDEGAGADAACSGTLAPARCELTDCTFWNLCANGVRALGYHCFEFYAPLNVRRALEKSRNYCANSMQSLARITLSFSVSHSLLLQRTRFVAHSGTAIRKAGSHT